MGAHLLRVGTRLVQPGQQGIFHLEVFLRTYLTCVRGQLPFQELSLDALLAEVLLMGNALELFRQPDDAPDGGERQQDQLREESHQAPLSPTGFRGADPIRPGSRSISTKSHGGKGPITRNLMRPSCSSASEATAS